MAIKELSPAEVGLPDFDPGDAIGGDVFGLGSHQRAREALEFGLAIRDPRFNIFVLGQERSGRLTSTVAFIRSEVASRPSPSDWVYLNNFRRPSEPRPYQLPAGVGYSLQRRMTETLELLGAAFREAFNAEELQDRVRREEAQARAGVAQEIETLRASARKHGLDLLQTPQGIAVVPVGSEGEPVQTSDMTENSAGRRSVTDPSCPASLPASSGAAPRKRPN